jgi:regulator of replication initiation timing
MDHKDEQLKLDEVKIEQLENQLRAAEEQEEVYAKEREDMEEEIREREDRIEELEGELMELASAAPAAHGKKDGRDDVYGASAKSDDANESDEENEDLKERIADLEEENEGLATELDELQDRLDELEDKLAEKEDGQSSVTSSPNKSSEGGDAASDEDGEHLKEQIANLTIQNETLSSDLQDLQDKLASFENLKATSEETIEKLTLSLKTEQEKSSNTAPSKNAASQVSQSTIADLEKTIAELEQGKAELDEEMGEAADAIAMLEDELDRKDGQVKELLMKLTMLQQQFSQAEKCKTALAERNAKLSSENDDLNTQVKVLIIEKTVAAEEIETLKDLKTIADEDQEEAEEEALLRKEEQKQELDALHEKMENFRLKSNEKMLALEQEMYQLEEAKARLEENLEESSDAITVLREALSELEDGKVEKDAQIRDLKSKLRERETDLKDIELTQDKLKSEHQVSVDTISTLQKMIASLESSKDILEEELNENSMELSVLKDQLKSKNTIKEVTELEREVRELNRKLAKSEESNEKLNKRISELNEANERMKGEVKDLGESLARVTNSRNHALVAPSPSLVSNDPVASCDALLSELKSQIKQIVSARNAALEEVEQLRSDASVASASELTIPPPANGVESKMVVAAAAEVPPPKKKASFHAETKLPPIGDIPKKKSSFHSRPSSSSNVDDSKTVESDPESDDKTMEKSMAEKSSAISYAGSRGSSLLEAAKKLCNQLDEKRSRQDEMNDKNGNNISSSESTVTIPKTITETDAKLGVSPLDMMSPAMDDEPVRDFVDDQEDDTQSAKEVKEDSPKESIWVAEPDKPNSVSPTPPPQPEEEKKDDPNRGPSSRNKPRLDIDQLTSIYFEKCGMSVSRFSDLSSDSSSFRRRASKSPNDTVTKKVKICRNGVFMGTYEGDLNTEGQRHGFGVLLCDNGNSYEGEWKKDKRDGLGIARYSSGDVYDGQWQRGKRQGHGVMYIEAGDTYIGGWNNGLKHGAGTYHWADGEVDVSWYQEDRRVGEGVRWNSSRSKAFRLLRGTKKEELSLDEAYMTAEKLGLNLEKFDSGVP